MSCSLPITLSPPPPNQSPDLHHLLDKEVIITLNHPLNRILEGTLTCIDSDMNLILRGVIERRFIKRDWTGIIDLNDRNEINKRRSKEEEEEDIIPIERSLSQAMILGKYIKKVEISKSGWEGACREQVRSNRMVIHDNAGID